MSAPAVWILNRVDYKGRSGPVAIFASHDAALAAWRDPVQRDDLDPSSDARWLVLEPVLLGEPYGRSGGVAATRPGVQWFDWDRNAKTLTACSRPGWLESWAG